MDWAMMLRVNSLVNKGKYIGIISDFIGDNIILNQRRVYADEIQLPDVDFCFKMANRQQDIYVYKQWVSLACRRLEDMNFIVNKKFFK